MSELTDRLRQLSDAVAEGNRAEFTMRVPADHKRDADIVLLDAAELIEEQQRKLDQLQKEFDALWKSAGEVNTEKAAAEHRLGSVLEWLACSPMAERLSRKRCDELRAIVGQERAVERQEPE